MCITLDGDAVRLHLNILLLYWGSIMSLLIGVKKVLHYSCIVQCLCKKDCSLGKGATPDTTAAVLLQCAM